MKITKIALFIVSCLSVSHIYAQEKLSKEDRIKKWKADYVARMEKDAIERIAQYKNDKNINQIQRINLSYGQFTKSLNLYLKQIALKS